MIPKCDKPFPLTSLPPSQEKEEEEEEEEEELIYTQILIHIL
jgi:hypothetical protein